MNKKLLATAAAASTLGGTIAGATLFAPGGAGAQEDTDESTIEENVRAEAGERIAAALQGLVDDGTLTDVQVDAVVGALQDARPEGFEGRRGGHRGHRGFGENGADLAGILGLESTEIREAIQGGSSLADIAAEQGVDSQELVDAIVAATEERVNGAVENGRIDQERADEILAGAADKAEDVVNGEFEGPRGPRGGFGQGAPTPEADA
ncbi:MAG: hypothetical protein AAF548_14530 [Actinomycetota bacterium]